MQAKRIHARELEMHMKSKKQLYACLTLEGKVHLQLNFNSPNLPAALWGMLGHFHAADHERKEEGKSLVAHLYTSSFSTTISAL